MKIFLDSANVEDIRTHIFTGIVEGVTTNPTLIRKSGDDPEKVYESLKGMGIRDISMEVVGTELNMIYEGKRLHQKFGNVATIKVPCTREGLQACKILREQGICVNVTLVFSAAQALLATKAKATYISPFVGRLDDNSFDGVQLIKDCTHVCMCTDTRVLAASIRDVKSVMQVHNAGADIATIPPSVLEKMYNHVLTDQGIKQFEEDYKTYHRDPA
tara:strand:- start:118 stop:765 length:648 start_codon:yes stop_codon:yes gene_type:complete